MSPLLLVTSGVLFNTNVCHDEIMDKYFTPDVKAIAKKVYAEGAFAQGFNLLELPEF